MSPVVSEPTDADFVVVGQLDELRRIQNDMVGEMRLVKSRVACLGIRMAAVERAAELNVHLRQVVLSFAAVATPVVMSVVLDQNLPSEQTPTVDFVRSISKLLLAFAACVGIPLLAHAIIDLQDARTVRTPRLLEDVTNTPSGDDGQNYGSTDTEDTDEDKGDEQAAVSNEE